MGGRRTRPYKAAQRTFFQKSKKSSSQDATNGLNIRQPREQAIAFMGPGGFYACFTSARIFGVPILRRISNGCFARPDSRSEERRVGKAGRTTGVSEHCNRDNNEVRHARTYD